MKGLAKFKAFVRVWEAKKLYKPDCLTCHPFLGYGAPLVSNSNEQK